MRRILRIWPLYYLLIVLAFFVLPHFLEVGGAENVLKTAFWPKLLLFIFFLPNLALKVVPVVPFASQAWSIGTEEQFYLVWPWLLKRFRRFLSLLLAGIPVVLILGRKLLVVLCDRLAPGHLQHAGILLGRFLDTFNIEFMAIGGLGAWLLFENKKKILSVLFHPAFQIGLYATILFSLATGLFGHVKVRYLFNAMLFTLLILNLAGNKNTLLKLESKGFRFLGKISYGLYMFHPLCFYLIFYSSRQFLPSMGIALGNTFLYPTVFLLTIGMSWLSYEFFEKYFLRKKNRYTLVSSGDKIESSNA